MIGSPFGTIIVMLSFRHDRGALRADAARPGRRAPSTSIQSPTLTGRSISRIRPLTKLLTMFCRPEVDADAERAQHDGQAADLNAGRPERSGGQ
jgi:hypothetical protein